MNDWQAAQAETDLLLNQVSDSVIVLDEQGGCRYCNAAACAAMGKTANELAGRRLQEVYPALATAQVCQHIEEAARGRVPVRFETDSGPFENRVAVTLIPLAQGMCLVVQNMSAQTLADLERVATIAILRMCNSSATTPTLLHQALIFLQQWFGCQAVGVRLKDGDDFPYFETRGFPDEFVEAERHLCSHDLQGQLKRDTLGDPVLECMCGNVICGRFDARLPFFTTHGSFWTNSTTRLLATTSERERQATTRNRCNGEGYESVALVPLKAVGRTLGLLQFNDRRMDRFTPQRIRLLERLADSLALAITQRQALQSLAASERRWQFALEGAGDGLWDWNARTGEVFFSPQWKAMLGYADSEIRGSIEEWQSRIHPDDRDRTLACIGAYLAGTTREYVCEHRLRCRDGSYKWILDRGKIVERDVAGAPLRVIGTHTDISASKRTEEALRSAQQRFSSAFNVNPAAMVITRLRDRTIVDVNEAYVQTMGISREELVGADSVGLNLVADTGVVEQLVALFEQQGSVRNFAVNLNTRTGRVRYGLISLERIEVDARECVLSIFYDMTEQHRLEESIQLAAKLESIGVLAGGIAHDFNNLLGGIFGYLDMAAQHNRSSAPQQVEACITKALKVFERARSLTRQLLIFSKGGEPVRRVSALQVLIEESTRFALAGSNVDCRFEIAPDLAPCECDTHQIAQVIDNIVINAKQAMPRGGTVVVGACNQSFPAGHKPDIAGGSFVRISIQDTGPGIPAGIISRIFDPFFTTKESGHGLGLATSFTIIKRHHGWIEVESKQGRGARFDVYLPVGAAVVPQPEKPSPAAGTGTGPVLVMDDESYMREIVGEMLVSLGCEVTLVGSGEEAVDSFRARLHGDRPFTACILDLTGPTMSGKETAAAIRAMDADVYLVAASGYSHDAVMAQPALYGFDASIVKPFRREQLAEVMQRQRPRRS